MQGWNCRHISTIEAEEAVASSLTIGFLSHKTISKWLPKLAGVKFNLFSKKDCEREISFACLHASTSPSSFQLLLMDQPKTVSMSLL